jgi:hypothetical protein
MIPVREDSEVVIIYTDSGINYIWYYRITIPLTIPVYWIYHLTIIVNYSIVVIYHYIYILVGGFNHLEKY